MALKYLSILSVFAFLGFSREFVFVNINNQLYKTYYKNNDIFISKSLTFLSNYNYETLYYAKYPLTVLYVVMYFTVSFYSVKIICDNKKITRWIVYIYSLLFTLSSFIMLYNYIINNQLSGEEYTFSRWLMGIAESPLVAF
ncbi:MAG: hypothetical protein KA210_07180, partial [Bacteroidia bacterium]|nr:hypothetical protein [Bacteroidia bacterium]